MRGWDRAWRLNELLSSTRPTAVQRGATNSCMLSDTGSKQLSCHLVQFLRDSMFRTLHATAATLSNSCHQDVDAATE